MSSPSVPSSSPAAFVELSPEQAAATTGGAGFDFGSLAQSVLQNVTGQLGGGAGPLAGILGQVVGMIGKGGPAGGGGAAGG